MATQRPTGKRSDDAQYLAAVRNFDIAARHLQRQNYEKAKELLERLLSSSAPEVADRARVYLQLCEQKLGRPVPIPKTAADYYYLGVAELNARHLHLALAHLGKADKSEPNREHIRYALAAVHALLGNGNLALDHLRAAIEHRAENRFRASNDEDFQSLSADPRFLRLVRSEGLRKL